MAVLVKCGGAFASSIRTAAPPNIVIPDTERSEASRDLLRSTARVVSLLDSAERAPTPGPGRAMSIFGPLRSRITWLRPVSG